MPKYTGDGHNLVTFRVPLSVQLIMIIAGRDNGACGTQGRIEAKGRSRNPYNHFARLPYGR